MNLKIEVIKLDEFELIAKHSGLYIDPYDISRVYILSDKELTLSLCDSKPWEEELFFADRETERTYTLNYSLKKYKFEYRIPGFFRYNESLGFDDESKERLDKILNEISEN